jgi:hypothetical protein
MEIKETVSIITLAFATLLLFGCVENIPIEHHFKVVGTNVTCTALMKSNYSVYYKDATNSYCGYSFFTPCSDGLEYKCVSVAKVV